MFRKMNGLALMGGLGLVFAGLIACSSDDTTSSKVNGDPLVRVDSTVTYDSSGNKIVAYDTTQASVDSIVQIDPVTGETITIYDTVFVPADSTVQWVGNSSLIITEVAPVNLDWLDENGEDPGWVEIYNAGDEEASLSGYSLTNNMEKPRKWVFDNETIKPKSFRVVFCDKGNLSKVESADEGELHKRPHTSWKLDKDGGSIYLIDRYYSIRDSVRYPEISSGMSYGIIDGGLWRFFDKPTPEKANTASTAYEGVAPKFDFKGKAGGFYSEPITLNVPTGLPEGMKVRCTQDGSLPTENSKEFNEPIKIDQSMVLRCAAYKKGLLTKEVVTNTYFIDEEVGMPVVAISVEPSFFDRVYIKTSAEKPSEAPSGLYEDIEYPVHVEYFADGSNSKEKAFEIDAGISLMGGYSRLNDKKSVAIEMHEEYQAGKIDYPLFETRKENNYKYKAFNLRNNGNRFVSDYIEDAMGGAILEGSGVDYQRSRQVVVFYNGKYYGIHDMRERFNRAYVETNYGINSSSVQMVKLLGADSSSLTSSGDDPAAVASFSGMLHTIGTLDMKDDANYETAKTLIDVGNYADYMAAEIYYHNGDWPNNNLRAWSAPGQPWKFMIYDLDHGFDWMWGVNGGEFKQSTNMFEWIKAGGGNKPCKTVGCFANIYISLIKNENFKRMFLHRSAVMLQNYLNSTNVAKVIDKMVATIPETEMERDLDKFKQDQKWYQNSCGHGFDKKGSCMKEWATERDSKVLSEYKSEFGVGDMVNVTISATNGNVLMEGMSLPGSTISSTNYKGKFFSGTQMVLTAVPNVGAVVDSWTGCEPVAGTDMCVATLDGDKTISATFK